MRFSTVAAPIALAGLVAAAPAPVKRDLAPRATAYDDGTILNYALTLEHLERTFYQQALNNLGPAAFSKLGNNKPYVRQRITEVANEEANHVSFLTSALEAAGVTPVPQCQYNFGAAITDAKTFLATAQIFEGIGVAAYRGAAPSITNKAYLAVAGSILVVEAEHNTWLRSTADTQDPFPRPYFAPLDFNQVYTLAAPFIKSCGGPALPFKPFPAVTIKPEPFYKAGCQLTVTTQATGAKYAAFISATSTVFVPYSGQSGIVPIPEGITGQSFLILTNAESISDSATVAGPAMINIDVPAQNFSYN